MSKFNFIRWLPIAIVFIAAFSLIHFSNTDIEMGEAQEAEKMTLPTPPVDYEPPNNLRNIFTYEAAYTPEVAQSTETGKAVKAKIKKGDLSGFFVNGIVWSKSNAMVSINGTLLSEGMTYKNLKVLKIMPDRVTVSLNGKIVVRTLHQSKTEVETLPDAPQTDNP